MKKKKNPFYHYHRKMSTIPELRANQETRDDGVREKWGRKRRNKAMLDPWCNEQPSGYQKSWKMKREKQYHVDGRGEKHSIVVDNDWRSSWRFEEYCREHNITYEVRRLHRLEYYWQYYSHTWECVGEEWAKKLKRTVQIGDNKKKKVLWTTEWYRRPKYASVERLLDKPIRRCRSITTGYELIWWSNKDIGMEYILRRLES